MLSRANIPSPAGQSGMTLIETLVAMVAGMVVVAALLTIMEVSLRQSSRLADVAQATQLGRSAMTRMMDELHSACVEQGFSPVKEKSTENVLIFVNGYGGPNKQGAEGKEEGKSEVANVGTAAEGVREDKIVWSSTAHTLTDYTYYATGKASNGEYDFASAASPSTGVRIGERITQIKEGTKTVPIFQYFAYASSAATSTAAVSSQLNETTLAPSGDGELSAANAETVASVLVSFRSSPSDGYGESYSEKQSYLGRTASMVSQATFAFSAPRPESAATEGPCE